MENKLLKIMLIVFVLFITIWLITPNVYATISTDFFEPRPMYQNDVNVTGKVGGYIIKVLTTVGVIVATLAIAILGLKYMLGSVDEKAEYKKSMMPFLIGVLMIVATFSIVSIIAEALDTSDDYQSVPRQLTDEERAEREKERLEKLGG